MKYIIVFVVFSALTAVAGSVIVGIRHFDGTVSESPYQEGLLWDEKQKTKAELGWFMVIESGQMTTGENELTLLVKGKDGKPVQDAVVSVMISRPATDIHDRTYQPVRVDNGIYKSTVYFPLYGYWDLKTRIEQGRNSIALAERVFVEKGGLTE